MGYFKDKKKELITEAFSDFLDFLKEKHREQFKRKELIDFINQKDYGLLAYTRDRDEYELENNSGKLAVSVFNFIKVEKKRKGTKIKEINPDLYKIII